MLKKIIIASLLIIIITTLAFSYYFDQTLLTRLEEKYNSTQNYNDLIHLCNNLYSTQDYGKQIKYYSKMLNDKEKFLNARKESDDAEKEYSIYTFWYLRALLHKENYDKYKTEFNNYFYKLNNLKIIEKLYDNYTENDDFNNQELNIILENAEENIKKLKDIIAPSKEDINRYKTLQTIRYNIYHKTNNKDKASAVLKEKNTYLKQVKQSN